jgi:glycosyltransferase involved in cell wall biosynthesis
VNAERTWKRVLFVTQTPGYGGAEKHTVELISHLEARGVEVTVLCLRRNVFESAFAKYGVRAKIETRALPHGLGKYVRCFRGLKADVFVFVSCEFGLFPWQSRLAARLAGARRVYDIEHVIADPLPSPKRRRGPLGWVRRVVGLRNRAKLAGRLATTFSDGTICCSDAVRERLVGEYGYNRRKTLTIRNGVNLSAYGCLVSRKIARERLGIPQDAEVVVAIASLDGRKRLDVLIGAMAIIITRAPSCRCLILGEGHLAEKLKAMVESCGLTSAVRFVGHVEDVAPYLAAGDLFVLSSDREGLPFALLEAMATGLPSVVTRAGGNAEVIRDGVEGRLVDCGDVPGLAKAMLNVLELKEERELMGARARARVERDFDLARVMDDLSRIILGRGTREVVDG